jgi:hypothetical protein
MIPSRLLFVWFGRRFPLGNLLALRSARRWWRPEEILLITDEPDALRGKLEECAAWPELRLERADAGWFAGLPHGADSIARDLFAGNLSAALTPATKANLIRLAALYKRGGVYLDFDTITIGDAARDPAALLARRAFCGAEPLALPAELFFSRNPLRWATAGVRLGVRQALASLPGGWRYFRALEKLYPAAPNNAVLGAEAGHPLLETCFRLMAELPPEERVKRFRLGTHLLQRAVHRTLRPLDKLGGVQAQRGAPKENRHGFDVLPPPFFYPLGPEIATHWFKRGTAKHLDAMLRPETVIVHWYNSVESRLGGKALTAEWVARHPDTAFAEMIRRFC